jgi:hypothetical protein
LPETELNKKSFNQNVLFVRVLLKEKFIQTCAKTMPTTRSGIHTDSRADTPESENVSASTVENLLSEVISENTSELPAAETSPRSATDATSNTV